ncbi:Spo0E family sporulation regulatory protein-aspartic acid phosphatase [Clostridium sp. LBM24168]
MNNNLKELEMQITKLKENLYMLIQHNNLTDYEVVQCSEELDKLILKYQKLKI